MSAKKKWSFAQLEQMNETEVNAILEEIPSDDESVVEDLESIINDETEIENINEPLEMDFIAEEPTQSNNNLQWDSDDDIPLARRSDITLPTIWTEDTTFVTRPIAFEELTGPNLPDSIESPTDVFLHLFSEDLISHIVFQTNLYCIQKYGENRNFTPTTQNELKKFIAINLLMGVKSLPSYRDYWSSHEALRDPFISAYMSRDRFSWLLSNIHLNDNCLQPKKNEPNYDKLYKIRPLLTKLQETFLSSMNPSEFQAVDESMIRFKGRCSIRQYMPMKPIKRGYKVWVRADSTGYMCDFQIYTGKVAQGTEKNLGQRVVTDLTKLLIGKGHKVFFDNYFNSVQLDKDLLRDKIYSCGTIRKARKNFPELKPDKSMQRGESDWKVSKEGLAALKWMDSRSVLFLGSYHDPSNLETVSRRKKDGTAEEILCPKMVKDYNAHMGYVDRFDMLKSLYEVDRKSHKWWHRILFYFIDAAVVNSFILFKERSSSKTIPLKMFRVSVALGLLGMAERTRGRPTREQPPNKFKKVVPYEVRYCNVSHMPERSTSLRCANCSTRSEAHRTIWKCSTCQVGLCLNKDRNCFAEYHKK